MAAVASGYIRLTYGSGGTDYVDLPIKSAKGLDDPDYFELWPAISNTCLDGAKDTQFQGFRRKVRISVGVVPSRDDRIKILRWFLYNSRTIDYNTGTYHAAGLSFVPQSPEGYENEWLENISLGRKFVFELDESAIRTSWPTET